MNFQSLEKNVTDVTKEQQIKLGYREEIVRLYYPLSSLNHFLGTNSDIEGMKQNLKAFRAFAQSRLGAIRFSNEGDRFCFAVPPEGAAYVHSQLHEDEFIVDFIHAIEKHGCTIRELIEVFQKHSEHVHVEQVENGEFNFLIYFEDGIPDDYRYCLEVEECHIIYHRFTQADYEDFDF